MKILTCGLGHCSQTYLYGAIVEILKSVNRYTGGNDHAIPEEINNIKPGTVLGSHSDLLNWDNSVNLDTFDKVFYVYRDIRNSIVSKIRHFSINQLPDEKLYDDGKIVKITSGALKAFEEYGRLYNYNCKSIDARFYSTFIWSYTNSWRQHIFRSQKIAIEKKNIILLKFEERIIDRLSDIKDIIEKLNIEAPLNEIYTKLDIDLNNGKYTHRANIPKNNTYQNYLEKKGIEIIEKTAGDSLCLLGYLSLENYSKFIFNNDEFIIILYKFNKKEEIENIRFFFKYFHKKIIKIINLDVDTLNFKPTQKYIVLTEDLDEFRTKAIQLSFVENTNFVIYPAFKFEIDDINFFNLNNGSHSPVNKIVPTKKQFLLYDNTWINKKKILYYFNEKNYIERSLYVPFFLMKRNENIFLNNLNDPKKIIIVAQTHRTKLLEKVLRMLYPVKTSVIINSNKFKIKLSKIIKNFDRKKDLIIIDNHIKFHEISEFLFKKSIYNFTSINNVITFFNLNKSLMNDNNVFISSLNLRVLFNFSVFLGSEYNNIYSMCPIYKNDSNNRYFKKITKEWGSTKLKTSINFEDDFCGILSLFSKDKPTLQPIDPLTPFDKKIINNSTIYFIGDSLKKIYFNKFLNENMLSPVMNEKHINIIDNCLNLEELIKAKIDIIILTNKKNIDEYNNVEDIENSGILIYYFNNNILLQLNNLSKSTVLGNDKFNLPVNVEEYDNLFNKKTVIFGASGCGLFLLESELVNLLNLDIVAFSDSDKNKHHSMIKDIQILPPQKLIELDFFVIIIASAFHKEIYKSLCKIEKSILDVSMYNIYYVDSNNLIIPIQTNKTEWWIKNYSVSDQR